MELVEQGVTRIAPMGAARGEERPAGGAPRRRITIVGGGMAGLTAAWALSRTPELRETYEVTVYQLGHRLGGKLASGRRPELGHRNEEHGLHVWFGFYENTFRLAREVLERWQPPPDSPIRSVEDIVRPIDLGTLFEQHEGVWRTFSLHTPRTADRPGSERFPPTALGFAAGVVDLLRVGPRTLLDLVGLEGWLRSARVPAGVRRWLWPVHGRRGPLRWTRLADGVAAELVALAAAPETATEARIATLHRQVRRLHRPIAALASAIPTRMRIAAGIQAVDLLLAIVEGLLDPEDGIWRDGDLDRIDHLELRAWLRRSGAAAPSVDWIGLRVLYDAFFQFADGDRSRPDFAAGTGLRSVLRFLFTYKRSIAFLLTAGMGEAFLAPLYEVLRDQGVRFRFFHRLERLELSAGGDRAARLHFVEQARVKGDYEPLYTFRGLRCWPAEPDWSQLVDGEALRERGVDFESRWSPPGEDLPVVLDHGRDFDEVILALPAGALRPDRAGRSVVREWIDRVPHVAEALEGLNLVPTAAAQLWTREPIEALGWWSGVSSVGWAAPVSVWCDMAPVLDHEGWGARGPQGLLYLCGVIATDAWQSEAPDARVVALEEVRGEVREALERDGDALLRTGFAWERLFDPLDRAGAARLDGQYLRVNVEPTDLCDSATTGTPHLRPEAHETGLANLAVASTWARTSINTTCVEAAAMSGLAAARAVGAEIQPIVGETFLCRPPVAARLADTETWLAGAPALREAS